MSDEQTPGLQQATLASLLGCNSRRWVTVDSKLANAKFDLCSLFEGELSRYEAAQVRGNGTLQILAARRQLVALCWRDKKTGERIVPDERVADLAKVDAAIVNELFSAASLLNGLTAKKNDED